MTVTIRDIARELGLSHTTVSRALNGREAISIPSATRDRIRHQANQMGYRPHHAARALATGRTHMVVLQFYRLSSPYAWRVAEEMQRLMRADGYEIVLREYKYRDLALQSQVDGILALDCAHYPYGLPPETPLRVPYVWLGAYGPPALDHVQVDLYAGAREAVEYLIRTGRRRIVHVLSRYPGGPLDPRERAYRDVMQESSLVEEYIVVPDDLRVHGREALTHSLERHGCPDAVFCLNDELAQGCCRAVSDRGLRVPEDVAVIGCDDIDDARYWRPMLTTISPPVAEMCRLGWEFLHRRINAPDAPLQSALLTPSLVHRESA